MPGQKIETGHEDMVHDVQMDYYGKRVATASSDCTIKITGVSNNGGSQHLATLTGHRGPVWQVAWAHPKFGSFLASCSYDGQVILWKEGSQNQWTQAHVFTDHKSSVNSIAWAPHDLGLSLACGSSDGNISVFTGRADGGWDTTKIDQAHPVGVTSVSWAPATAPGALVSSGLLDPVYKLASGGCDNTVKVWKLSNGSWKMDCFPALQKHTDWVRDVAWAPNLGLPKSTIASGSQDGKVIIWTVGKEGEQWEGKVLKDFMTPVWRVSWSLTGNMLAVSDGNNNMTVWKEAVDGEWEQAGLVVYLKSKLYRFDKDGSQWKERGAGTVKFLKHKESGKIRLVMRQSKTLKICANHLVTSGMSVQEHAGNDKSCVWHARDFSDGELKDELFCIRFASVESEFESVSCVCLDLILACGSTVLISVDTVNLWLRSLEDLELGDISIWSHVLDVQFYKLIVAIQLEVSGHLCRFKYCKAFMQKFKEVADSEEESKEASDTAGLLEKLTVEEKDTEEKKEEKPVEKVASAEEAEKAVEEKKTEESVPSA
ncbi:hypothetical protein HID58_051667 [Brassica napus]|uniref:RanBD1 domain-containing protein n=1 Tax=Brassica napus TaxID=3708 RepID=A0ABQ8AAG6_BRANA|nr:hypothetical protein HID58_051667 [Brassica napus]